MQTAMHQRILFITVPVAWTTSTMPKRTEHNLNVCIGKSEAEETYNRSLHSRYCTVEANYWHTRSIARPLSGTAELLTFTAVHKKCFM